MFLIKIIIFSAEAVSNKWEKYLFINSIFALITISNTVLSKVQTRWFAIEVCLANVFCIFKTTYPKRIEFNIICFLCWKSNGLNHNEIYFINFKLIIKDIMRTTNHPIVMKITDHVQTCVFIVGSTAKNWTYSSPSYVKSSSAVCR